MGSVDSHYYIQNVDKPIGYIQLKGLSEMENQML
jgi:hypothetical protein